MDNLWSWPLPGWVPHEFSFDLHGQTPGYNGQQVCAVEAGKIVRIDQVIGCSAKNSIEVVGPSGLIRYLGFWPSSSLAVGMEVYCGQSLGQSAGGFVLDTGEIANAPVLLQQAWARVTNRFHREAPAVPQDPEERRKLMSWLQDHKMWTHPMPVVDPDYRAGSMQECLDFDFVYVDPTLERIVGPDYWPEDPRNNAFRVWIETGGWVDNSLDPHYPIPPLLGWDEWNKWTSCHDTLLDCGASSMEEALLQLAVRVRFFYGDTDDHLPGVPKRCEGHFEDGDTNKSYISGCTDASDGFCATCGFLIDPPKIED